MGMGSQLHVRVAHNGSAGKNVLVGSYGDVKPRFWFKDKRVEGGAHQAWSPGEWYDFNQVQHVQMNMFHYWFSFS